MGERRRRPMRWILRALDRALLGPLMTVAAVILERKVIAGIKEKPAGATATAGAADRSRAQG